MKNYSNEQRYLALRKISLWLENDHDKAEAAEALMSDEEAPANTEAQFDRIADICCTAVEQIDPTVFSTGIVNAGEPLKNLIIGALIRKERDLSSFSGGPDGVSEDDYEDVANEIVSAFTTKGGNNV